MIVKAALAALLALSSPANPHIASPWHFAVAQPAATQTDIDPSLHPEVVRVDCLTGRGSAFKVGPHTLITVAHVSNIGGCFIQGRPIKVVSTSGDFAILSSDETADSWLHIDCGGFVAGRQYEALGYARGLPILTTVDVIAVGDKLGGFSRLWGVFTVIPGQSGGPIVDESSGDVVGTVNVYNAESGMSGSIALKDTSVCKGKSA